MKGIWLFTACMITMVAAAQDADVDTTYEFVLKDGKSVFGWIQEDRHDDLIVKVDAPWEGRERIVTLREKSIESKLPENAAAREARIEQGWKDRNYTLVETANGQQWIPKVEVTLAKRAAKLAKDATPKAIPHIPDLTEDRAPAAAPTQDEPHDEEAEPPGFLAGRGAQGALLLVACLVIGLIVKFVVLRSEE